MQRVMFSSIVPSSMVPSMFRRSKKTGSSGVAESDKLQLLGLDDWARQETCEPDPSAADLEEHSPTISQLDSVEEQWAPLPGCVGGSGAEDALPGAGSTCATPSARTLRAEQLGSASVQLSGTRERAMVKPRGWATPSLPMDPREKDTASLKEEFRMALFGGLRDALQTGSLEEVVVEIVFDERAVEASAVRDMFAQPLMRGAERALHDGSLECTLEELAFEERLRERQAVKDEFRIGLFQGLGQAVDDGSLEELLEELAFHVRLQEREAVREEFHDSLFAELSEVLGGGELERALREVVDARS